jgi:hypothetical protein
MADAKFTDGRIPVTTPGNLPASPTQGEAVHGGFRSNRHYDAIEQLADERGMGRELLRQTEDLYPDAMLTEGVEAGMNSVTPAGTSDYKTSKWSDKK